MLTVPPAMVKRWESSYRFYQQADLVAGLPQADVMAVADMARASREVATSWRAFSGVEGLPWWAVAAVMTASQAFDAQAKEWEQRARERGWRP